MPNHSPVIFLLPDASSRQGGRLVRLARNANQLAVHSSGLTPGLSPVRRDLLATECESLEPRTMLSAAPIQFGAVYTEQDFGSDASPDTIEISFVGGAEGTQLSRIELDGDQHLPGLSLADVIFDTQLSGLGVDLPFDGLIASMHGDFQTQITVEDGSSLLVMEFVGFLTGDRLTLNIDVDEIQGFDPDEQDLSLINEELDPIASGAEFQGTLLTAYFTAPHFHDAVGNAEFRNRYDQNLEPTDLDLPLDDEFNNRDRTAGAVGEATQSPLPISISGRVYEDRNVNLNQDADDPGLDGVQLDLFVEVDGAYVFTGHTAITNAQGDYVFSEDLGLLPGEYQLRETQPEGYFSVGAETGTVDGVGTGSILTSDILTSISIPNGGTAARNYNFAEARNASIRGRVHLSTPDGDCWDDSIEHDPVVGATVLLVNEAGETVAETQTDANGTYEFLGLRPGQYSLIEITPESLIEGGAQAGIVDGETRGDAEASSIREFELFSGDEGVEFEFCDHPPAQLAGNVYHDRNNNGLRDVGEEGIADALLSLLDEEGELVDTTETDENGQYEFVGLRAGNYRVIELQPTGWLDGKDRAGTANGRSTGRALNPGDEIEAINLLWGDAGMDFDFGELKPGTLSGRVHLSTPDGDCWDIDEDLLEPIAGAVVQLLGANGQVLAESVTDDEGNYAFGDLEPGDYSVRQITPDGFVDGGARSGHVEGEQRGDVNAIGDITNVRLNSDESGTNYDFCDHKPATISGFVYEDEDNDGVRDPGEGPIEGVIVRLYDEDGNLVVETTTDEDGKYVFEGLPPGKYSLEQIQPDGYLDGIDSEGTIEGERRGRAMNPGDRITEITIGWGETGKDYNFGELRPALIRGSVHSSPEENCWEDEDAEPIGGVRILLLGSDGQTIAETTTNAMGHYEFADLPPGSYSVQQIQPDTHFDGAQRAGSAGGDASLQNHIVDIDVVAGEMAIEYDFCEQPASALSGFVFVDGDPVELLTGESLPEDLSGIRNGELTDDDQRLAGVVLELRNGQRGTPIHADAALPGMYEDGPIRTTTDANGYYEFTGIPKGNYAIYEIHPDEYVDGIDTAGTADGIPINPVVHPEDEPFFRDLINGLEDKPDGNDAILAIALFPGVHSQFNNFSEVQTLFVDPPVDPPGIPPLTDFPSPSDPPPGLNIGNPALYRYVRDIAPVPLFNDPIPNDGSSGARANTWHLSVIDGGQPRVSNSPQDVELLFPTAIWQQHHLTGAEWAIELKDGDINTHFFGLKNSYPITGDFNGDGSTEIGVFAKGHWFIDLNGNGRWDSEDLWAKLGYEGDLPVVGDWDGDGKDDIGIFGRAWPDDPIALRLEHGLPDMENVPDGAKKNMPPVEDENDIARSRRVMKHTARGKLREDIIDHVFVYGSVGDIGVVGDWNGDGIDTLGIVRGGVWHLDVDGNGRWTDPDEERAFGEPGDYPLVGDFNGDGIDDMAIVRNGKIYIDANGNRQLDTNDIAVRFDEHEGLPVVGKWHGDGKDRIATFKSVDQEPITVASRPETE